MKFHRCWLALAPVLAISGCLPPVQPVQPAVPVPAAVPAPPVPAPASAETLRALAQLTDIKEELKKLRNQIEELQFDTENAKRRQQNLSQDLDRRLLSLERAQRLLERLPPPVDTSATGNADVAVVAGDAPTIPADTDAPGVAAAGATPPESGATPPESGATPPEDGVAPDGDNAGAVSLQEEQAYEQAFNLLKQSRYEEAIAQFQALADAWPAGELADDAHYWMSEARYVNREFEAALSGFEAVVKRYPDSQRAPEALLKMGYIQYDIGAYSQAADIFREVLVRYPDHQVAVPAQTRLRRIEKTIQ